MAAGVERRREAELWIYTYVYGGGCKIEKDIISDIQKLCTNLKISKAVLVGRMKY